MLTPPLWLNSEIFFTTHIYSLQHPCAVAMAESPVRDALDAVVTARLILRLLPFGQGPTLAIPGGRVAAMRCIFDRFAQCAPATYCDIESGNGRSLTPSWPIPSRFSSGGRRQDHYRHNALARVPPATPAQATRPFAARAFSAPTASFRSSVELTPSPAAMTRQCLSV